MSIYLISITPTQANKMFHNQTKITGYALGMILLFQKEGMSQVTVTNSCPS